MTPAASASPTVRADPDLAPAERETTIRWATDEERATIHTDEPAIIRSLLAHEHFETDEERQSDGAIVSLRGTLPIACLTIKGTQRSDDNAHHGVVP